jgi:hypothetical protein
MRTSPNERREGLAFILVKMIQFGKYAEIKEETV